LRAPVISVYNTIKFSGYALSPIILSFFYGDGRLACGAAIILSLILTLRMRHS